MRMIWVKPKRCMRCNYDLTSHEIGNFCPECNTEIEYVQIKDPVEKILRSKWSIFDNPKKIAIIMLLLAIFGCCVLAPILVAIGPVMTGMSRSEWEEMFFQ